MSVRFGQDDPVLLVPKRVVPSTPVAASRFVPPTVEKSYSRSPRYGKTCCFTRLPLATLLHQLKGCYAVVPRIGSQAAMLAYFLQ
jgi:hypothetical protein